MPLKFSYIDLHLRYYYHSSHAGCHKQNITSQSTVLELWPLEAILFQHPDFKALAIRYVCTISNNLSITKIKETCKNENT